MIKSQRVVPLPQLGVYIVLNISDPTVILMSYHIYLLPVWIELDVKSMIYQVSNGSWNTSKAQIEHTTIESENCAALES